MAKLGPNQMTWGERSNSLLLPLAEYVKRGKGESASVIWETRGKRWGSGKRVGGWLMKGKEIGRLLGDHKGEGGGYVCIKTK